MRYHDGRKQRHFLVSNAQEIFNDVYLGPTFQYVRILWLNFRSFLYPPCLHMYVGSYRFDTPSPFLTLLVCHIILILFYFRNSEVQESQQPISLFCLKHTSLPGISFISHQSTSKVLFINVGFKYLVILPFIIPDSLRGELLL